MEGGELFGNIKKLANCLNSANYTFALDRVEEDSYILSEMAVSMVRGSETDLINFLANEK